MVGGDQERSFGNHGPVHVDTNAEQFEHDSVPQARQCRLVDEAGFHDDDLHAGERESGDGGEKQAKCDSCASDHAFPSPSRALFRLAKIATHDKRPASALRTIVFGP